MSDLRKYPRVPSRLRCWCEGNNITFYARVGNMSEGGLYLKTRVPLPNGTRARLRLEPQEGVELRADATVVWSSAEATGVPAGSGAGMGLRFEGLGRLQAERLRQVVHEEQTMAKGLA